MKQNEKLKREDETLDSFYHGRILILQKKKGYRFSVDAPLLADFIQTQKKDHLLELGTGSGIISLLLTVKPLQHITGVEVQPYLVDLALRNLKLNQVEHKITVIEQDLRYFNPEQKYDLIFSNPPYIKKEKGRLSPSWEKSVAKHELKCDINEIMKKTKQLLKKEGRAYFIYPGQRENDFREVVREYGLRINSIRYVSPKKEREPNLFLTQCSFIPQEMVYYPPLILFNEEGDYTPEVKEIFAGRANAKFT